MNAMTWIVTIALSLSVGVAMGWNIKARDSLPPLKKGQRKVVLLTLGAMIVFWLLTEFSVSQYSPYQTGLRKPLLWGLVITGLTAFAIGTLRLIIFWRKRQKT